MATLGLRDLFMAPITETDGVETYGTPTRLAKAIKAEMSVDVAEGVLYSDDSVDETVKEFVKGTLKLNTNDLDPEVAVKIFGQYMDANKVTFAGENDDPPYIAVGFRAKKPHGKFRYIWLYKVKFKIPSESFETKGDGITFSTPEIEGEFIKRDADGMWKADYTGLPSDSVASTWFNSVKEYVEPAAE